MIDMATIQSVCKQWVSRYAGIGLAFCVMQNEPRVMHQGVLAVLSWVIISGVGVDDLREQPMVEVPTAILASAGQSSASPQTLSGTALNGAIGAGAISPPQPVEIVLSSSASWLAGTAVVTGVDAFGATVTDSLDVPAGGGATALGSVPFASVLSVAMPAAGGTAGTFTVGLAATLSPQAMTLRKMVLQVSIETQNQDPTVNGGTLIERLRGYAYTPSSVALLKTANLGLIDVEDSTQSDYRVDGRVISRYLTTVAFNQADTTLDVFGTRGTIESVDVTSHIADVDDTQLPLPLQWNHHDIP